MKIVIIAIIIIVVGIVLFGFARTYKTQTSKNQEKFLAGKMPDPLPDGEYRGAVTGYKGAWRGKTFFADQNRGINNFQDDPKAAQINQRQPFQTSQGKGIRDNDLDVFKIDYNVSGNAFWAKPILDEVVEVEPGKYLGKIHYRIFPGFSFAIGYFRLEK